MIDLVFQNLTDSNSFDEKFFYKVLEVTIKELKLTDKNIGVSINIVGEDKIKELNKEYRDKDKITDVLSFPMDENNDAGDIFICLPFAKKEAKSENISIEKKLAQLTVHGFLHLAGYDHERSERDAEEMFSLEKRIFMSLRFNV